jgi:predicted peptidase
MFSSAPPAILILLAILTSSPCLADVPVPGKQVEMVFKCADQANLPYLLYLPKAFEPGKSTPIMLFLHGRGESDGPLSVVAKWGPPMMVVRGDDLPFIVVSPQCPKEDNWSSETQQKRLMELLESTIQAYGADRSRVYLSGLSMGGSGSWKMLSNHPKKFAAVVPICGRGEINDMASIKDVPIWAFVGDQDRVFESNVQLIDAIRKSGNQSIRFTTLENVGHNSWSAAYATPDLYDWMAKQKSGN